MARSRRQGDYGIDAPYVPLGFSLAALAGLVAMTIGFAGGPEWLVGPGFGFAVSFSLMAATYLFATRRGKHAVWAELLDQLELRGDERVLDVGCGRGAVLLLAAARVPRGRAVGIDLWSAHDQSGNAEAVTRRNAELEGVSDRVELVTGDMRELPLPDGSFDVVVSSLAIHNLSDPRDRVRALDEIVRVLKPGGRVVIADFRFTDDYQRHLQERLGGEVRRRGLGWRFWYGGPQAATSLVRGRKPA